MKTKIYLAKSNRANPDQLMWVRSILAKYPKDIEVVEFKGGAYSHKDLKTCDILLVLPDLSEYDDCNDDYIAIGRGLHEQIVEFKKTNRNKGDALVVIGCEETWTSVVPIDDLDISDEDDYVNYSMILIDTEEVADDVDSLVKNRFTSLNHSEATNKTNHNDMMFVLIKK